ASFRHGLLAFTIGTDCLLHLAWQRAMGLNGAVVSSPTVANGVVYYGDGPGNQAIALDASTGALLWTSGATITDGIYAPPVVVNGWLFVGSWDHALHAYALSTGAPTNLTPPSITGPPQQGQTLTASPGTWSGSPTAFAYAWMSCDASGAGCTGIAGASQ